MSKNPDILEQLARTSMQVTNPQSKSEIQDRVEEYLRPDDGFRVFGECVRLMHWNRSLQVLAGVSKPRFTMGAVAEILRHGLGVHFGGTSSRRIPFEQDFRAPFSILIEYLERDLYRFTGIGCSKSYYVDLQALGPRFQSYVPKGIYGWETSSLAVSELALRVRSAVPWAKDVDFTDRLHPLRDARLEAFFYSEICQASGWSVVQQGSQEENGCVFHLIRVQSSDRVAGDGVSPLTYETIGATRVEALARAWYIITQVLPTA